MQVVVAASLHKPLPNLNPQQNQRVSGKTRRGWC